MCTRGLDFFVIQVAFVNLAMQLRVLSGELDEKTGSSVLAHLQIQYNHWVVASNDRVARRQQAKLEAGMHHSAWLDRALRPHDSCTVAHVSLLCRFVVLSRPTCCRGREASGRESRCCCCCFCCCSGQYVELWRLQLFRWVVRRRLR